MNEVYFKIQVPKGADISTLSKIELFFDKSGLTQQMPCNPILKYFGYDREKTVCPFEVLQPVVKISEELSSDFWIGVDLDGTLAKFPFSDFSRIDPFEIGDPIPLMVRRVKEWIDQGYQVKIFTARVSKGWQDQLKENGISQDQIDLIEPIIRNWCKEHIGFDLPVTCCKDNKMIALWDDIICRQVERNTGAMAGILKS